MENLTTIAYMIYLPVTITLTLYVAHMLFKNAKVFMLDIFKGKEDIAAATNKLFQIGFYLMNIGYALLIMKIATRVNPIESYQELVEKLAHKTGGFAMYLGIMLFLNLFLFFRGRKKARQGNVQVRPVRVAAQRVPPIPPQQ